MRKMRKMRTSGFLPSSLYIHLTLVVHIVAIRQAWSCRTSYRVGKVGIISIKEFGEVSSVVVMKGSHSEVKGVQEAM